MDYLNSSFKDAIKNNKKYKDAIPIIQNEVIEFYNDFHDDPNINSEWGHYYFCDNDGGRLIFDINKPHIHKCEVCGKEFKNEIYDGVWVYYYRNEAVLTAWKSAFLYRYTEEQKYLDITKNIIYYYAKNYLNFKIHNKERGVFDSYQTMKWGCGRILPQGLNEAIICIRMIQALELVKDYLDKEYIDFVYENMFKEMYELFSIQVDMIHNIRCWSDSAIGLIGLFFNKKDIIDFAFDSKYGINEQIKQGVTTDNFWYEGSIHYNFFTLEGISALLLFSKIYNHEFKMESTVENMFISAYHYAFNNHYFPNPNDGWPSINLKTYGYIYHTATRYFGPESKVGNILKIIESSGYKRTTLPLSKPYYINNDIAFEALIFNPDMDYNKHYEVKQETRNFPDSNFAMLRNGKINAFIKYGLNGPSHSHPDIINLEVSYGDYLISRDISNAGYRAKLCNEWHRKSLAHNTVIMNGTDIVSTNKGNTIYYDENHIICEALDVYPQVVYRRDVKLIDNGLEDVYYVISEKNATFDYIFHLESNISIVNNYRSELSNLGYSDNGYQHVSDVKKLEKSNSVQILGLLNDKKVLITIDSKDKEVYILKTLDNPVNKTRNSILVRAKGNNIKYSMKLEVKE